MKINNLRIFSLGLLLWGCHSLNATVFRIIRIEPVSSIKIGAKICGLQDTFNASDTIFWGDAQSLDVICIETPCDAPFLSFTKEEFSIAGSANRSYSNFLKIRPLVGYDNSLANSIDTLTFEGDEIFVDWEIPDLETYTCTGFIVSQNKVIPLSTKNGKIQIEREDFFDAGDYVELLISCYNAKFRTSLKKKYILKLNKQ